MSLKKKLRLIDWLFYRINYIYLITFAKCLASDYGIIILNISTRILKSPDDVVGLSTVLINKDYGSIRNHLMQYQTHSTPAHTSYDRLMEDDILKFI